LRKRLFVYRTPYPMRHCIKAALTTSRACPLRLYSFGWIHKPVNPSTADIHIHAQRVQVAEHTLRRRRVPPSVPDDLAFPATVPSSGALRS